MRNASLILLTLMACLLASPVAARALDTFEEDYQKPAIIDSPMWMALELKMGPYVPGNGSNSSFKNTFGNDKGWLLSVEYDVTLYHIPYIGQLNLGTGFGWAAYDAKALDPAGNRTSETTKFVIYPLSAMAVLRVDALARYTVVPLTFAGKLGGDFVPWKASTGSATDANGLNKGFRWAAQAALELDFFNPQSARRMDEEWGINHTTLLFELYQSMTHGTGDRTFQIGLGTQF